MQDIQEKQFALVSSLPPTNDQISWPKCFDPSQKLKNMFKILLMTIILAADTYAQTSSANFYQSTS